MYCAPLSQMPTSNFETSGVETCKVLDNEKIKRGIYDRIEAHVSELLMFFEIIILRLKRQLVLFSWGSRLRCVTGEKHFNIWKGIRQQSLVVEKREENIAIIVKVAYNYRKRALAAIFRSSSHHARRFMNICTPAYKKFKASFSLSNVRVVRGFSARCRSCKMSR